MPEHDRHGPIDPAAVPARLRSLPSRLIGRTALHADRISHAHLATAGATRWQYAALVTLRDGGPASQAQLSDRTGIHRSDMVAVLAALTEAGHVERAPDPTDRRRNVVTLTTAGRTHLRDLDRRVDAAQTDLLAPLTPPERAELIRLLRRLDDHHRTH
ncbi:MarR family transcriptional regulator [Frankia canadensis]|uniref:MarR family transcriptional regulator n=1 Tax=Frankia canadensis TaxID=1836972 RepID=A0A2I2KS34_9ACTN|nr:MarR family winged helix-turn-helix transcriptional regulator [Frankia canadensis]SNQ48459.1 MarR family transcriptional regulator [Frankia canadensis]SOU55749.1 MarR family transcriptional regulator [Frankia canadensis]